MTNRSVYYAPGRWALFYGADTVLLAHIERDDVLLADLWRVVEENIGLDGILAQLAQAGLGRVPAFALVHPPFGGGKVVLRGQAVIELERADGHTVELRCPTGVTTWLEHPIGDSIVRIQLTAGEQSHAGPHLPLGQGVAWAASVTIEPAHTAHDHEATKLADAIAADEAPTSQTAPPPVSDLPDDGESAHQPDAHEVRPYDHLFEATRARTVEDAAVRVEIEEQKEQNTPLTEEPPPPDPAGTLSGPTDAVVARFEASIETGVDSPRSPSVIAAVPGISSGQQEEKKVAGPREDIPDDRTVKRSDIDSAHSRSTGPVVHAVECPSGHLNPPHAGTCRVCGADLAPAAPITVPRPPLGVLKFSTGDTVTLDRGLLLGRSPEIPAGYDRDAPNVVRLPSPNQDISRNHLEVTLDGWHVLVTDLRSTNGTLYTIPGQAAQRLRPDEPTLITPGTVVDLAHEVSFVFEVES